MATPANAAPPRSVDPYDPDLGANVTIFGPDTPLSEIQATLDDLADAAARQRDGLESARRLLPAGRLRHRRGTAAVRGRLLHRGRRPRREPRRRRDQRRHRGLQPLPRERRHLELPRPRQLLAHDLEPLAAGEQGGPGRLPPDRELLGRLAGGLDAPPRHHRQRLAHGLLHRRSAVRERRLHRRHAAAEVDQRLAAAMADAQQRGRQLEQRRLEPGLLRRHRGPRR